MNTVNFISENLSHQPFLLTLLPLFFPNHTCHHALAYKSLLTLQCLKEETRSPYGTGFYNHCSTFISSCLTCAASSHELHASATRKDACFPNEPVHAAMPLWMMCSVFWSGCSWASPPILPSQLLHTCQPPTWETYSSSNKYILSVSAQNQIVKSLILGISRIYISAWTPVTLVDRISNLETRMF